MGGSDGGFPKVPQRSEDNFGKPLDALDGLPPEGSRKSRVGARNERAWLSNPLLHARRYSDTERDSGRRKRSGSEACRTESRSVCLRQSDRAIVKCDSAASREERSGFAALQCRMGKERWLGVLAGAYPGEHGPEKALL